MGLGRGRGRGGEWKTSLGCRLVRHDHQEQEAQGGGSRRGSGGSEGRARPWCHAAPCSRAPSPAGTERELVGHKVRSVDIPVLTLPGKPEFDLLFPNFLVISRLEYLLKTEERHFITYAPSTTPLLPHLTSDKRGNFSAKPHSNHSHHGRSAELWVAGAAAAGAWACYAQPSCQCHTSTFL